MACTFIYLKRESLKACLYIYTQESRFPRTMNHGKLHSSLSSTPRQSPCFLWWRRGGIWCFDSCKEDNIQSRQWRKMAMFIISIKQHARTWRSILHSARCGAPAKPFVASRTIWSEEMQKQLRKGRRDQARAYVNLAKWGQDGAWRNRCSLTEQTLLQQTVPEMATIFSHYNRSPELLKLRIALRTFQCSWQSLDIKPFVLSV